MKSLFRWAAPAFVCLGFLCGTAMGADQAGVLKVEDNAGVFSTEGIDKAKAAMAETMFHAPTRMTVVTYGKIPADKRDAFERVKAKDADRKRFFADWAMSEAKSRKVDVLVFISMEGGHIRAIDDRQTDVSRNFGSDDLKTLEQKFSNGFASAIKESDAGLKKALHDTALSNGVTFVIDQLKNTTVPVAGTKAATTSKAEGGGMGLLGWICIGVAVFLGLWLVIGLIRSMTGGGGGGGYNQGMAGGGFGGGMGGGGGGFMSGLIGGMFGAVAGHYLYDNFFGGSHSSPASAGDYGGTSGATTDTGAGDYDGGGDGGGTDFGGGDTGGADFGGGSDFGGSDFGGGGGDFGGGGDW